METTKENIYKTSDFNLAVYLIHRGAKHKKTEPQDENRKCTFVLEVPEEVDFTEIIKDWYSDKADEVKHILHTSRFLRSEVKRTYNSPAYE